uniref:Uncharacterized protein n=1 Tax=Nelumbo nucifera TaxID=4432 RepID=A0A822YRY1_NELNU|nr:TPA_asm: hypothetical protein HUJ06_005523 [Nelumbo nucifera]
MDKWSRMTAERLDKALATQSWLQIFPDSKILHLQFNHSDHCPLLLNTRPSKENTKPHFRFLPIWANHEDCKEIVESTWGKQIPGSKARQVTVKLKECKNINSRNGTRKSLEGWMKGFNGCNKKYMICNLI